MAILDFRPGWTGLGLLMLCLASPNVGFAGEDGDGSSSALELGRFLRQVEEAKLTAGDAGAGNELGWSVSVSGDAAVVGAVLDDDACPADPKRGHSNSAQTDHDQVTGRSGAAANDSAAAGTSPVSTKPH